MIALRTRRIAVFSAIALLLAVVLLRLAFWMVAAVAFPFGLDYGEGIVWKQMIDIVAGHGYPPVSGYPAIVFHYPPVYHLVSAALAGSGMDGLMAGRLVSSLASVGCMTLIGWFATAAARTRPEERLTLLLGAAFGPAAFASLFAGRYWAPLMRVDPLACVCELGGLACAIGALRRPSLIYIAAALFVIAFFTKQTEVAGPLAAIGILLLARPATALKGAATGIVLGGLALAALQMSTDGRFIRHTFFYNLNRFDKATFIHAISTSLHKSDWLQVPVGLVAAVATAVPLVTQAARARRMLATDRRTAVNAILLVFLLLKTLSLAALGKSGGSSNYLYEWEAAIAIYIGVAGIAALDFVARKWPNVESRRAMAVAAACALFAAWCAFAPQPTALPDLAKQRAESTQLLPIVKAVKGDVISDDMVLLLRAGREVTWEPAIFQELASTGQYDERPFIHALHDGRIGAVVVERWGDSTIGFRFTPKVAAAIWQMFPIEQQVGNRYVHRPR